MSKKRWSKKRLIVAALVIICIGLIWFSDLHKNLSFEKIKANTVWLHDQVEHYHWWTVMVYIGSFISVVVSCIPGAALMSIIGGFLFGMLEGLLLIITGATIGATLFFLLVRYVLGSYLQMRFKERIVEFNRLFDKKGWLYLLMLRCLPLIPFFMINLFAGLTNVRLSTFIWTTIIGLLPTSLIFCYAGTQIKHINCFADIFTAPIIIALLLMLVLVFLPVLINRYRKIF